MSHQRNQRTASDSPLSTQTATTISSPVGINAFDVALQPHKKIHSIFKKVGYQNASKIINTLQGSIWRAVSKNGRNVVIKCTDIQMHKESRAVIKDKSFLVLEDIMMEQSILKYIAHQQDCPNCIVKYVKFFKRHVSVNSSRLVLL